MRLLDLFCGAGGAAVGYHRAGFDLIIGVDHVPQPDFPFAFVQDDALEVPRTWDLDRFDLIHASPPCQSYSTMSNRHGSDQPELIDVVRDLIGDRPYVIENVLGARPHMRNPITLTGDMFELDTHRPRLFETSFPLMQPMTYRTVYRPRVAVYGKPDGRRLWTRTDGTELRAWASIEEGQQALEIDWTDDWHQLREAIPPAYTQYIGEQFISSVTP